jgi:hypothetical protein
VGGPSGPAGGKNEGGREDIAPGCVAIGDAGVGMRTLGGKPPLIGGIVPPGVDAAEGARGGG